MDSHWNEYCAGVTNNEYVQVNAQTQADTVCPRRLTCGPLAAALTPLRIKCHKLCTQKQARAAVYILTHNTPIETHLSTCMRKYTRPVHLQKAECSLGTVPSTRKCLLEN